MAASWSEATWCWPEFLKTSSFLLQVSLVQPQRQLQARAMFLRLEYFLSKFESFFLFSFAYQFLYSVSVCGHACLWLIFALHVEWIVATAVDTGSCVSSGSKSGGWYRGLENLQVKFQWRSKCFSWKQEKTLPWTLMLLQITLSTFFCCQSWMDNSGQLCKGLPLTTSSSASRVVS